MQNGMEGNGNGREWKGMDGNGREWKGMEGNGMEWKTERELRVATRCDDPPHAEVCVRPERMTHRDDDREDDTQR